MKIGALNPALTPASARVLRQMLDEDEELVNEGLTAYVGSNRTSVAVIYHLLREVLIRDVSDQNGMKRYVAQDEVRQTLDDPTYETRWREHLRTGKPIFR